MTEEHRSQLSALADGELHARGAARLCDLAGRDPGLRAAWERYHLIGQAIRGEPIVRGVRGLADAVRHAVEHEPIPIVAPASRPRREVRLAPFAGVALAAGVALLAVLAVPTLLRGPEPDGWPPPRGERYAHRAPGQPGDWQRDRPDLAYKLDLFLVNHQEAAPAAGVKGMLPYATLVGYDGGR